MYSALERQIIGQTSTLQDFRKIVSSMSAVARPRVFFDVNVGGKPANDGNNRYDRLLELLGLSSPFVVRMHR